MNIVEEKRTANKEEKEAKRWDETEGNTVESKGKEFDSTEGNSRQERDLTTKVNPVHNLERNIAKEKGTESGEEKEAKRRDGTEGHAVECYKGRNVLY